MDQNQTPEMDALVNSLLRGARFLLFTPGSFYSCAAGACTAFGVAFLISTLMPALLADNSTGVCALSEMTGVGLGTIFASTPALMVVHGVAVGPKLWSRPTALCLGIVVLNIVSIWSSVDTFNRVAASISPCALGLATWLVGSVGFTFVRALPPTHQGPTKVLLEQLSAKTA